MIRFWFVFDFTGYEHEIPAGTQMGCGITAFDLPDAEKILQRFVFRMAPLPAFTIREGIDIRTLDQGHIIPNMLPPNWRGVWFPLGYWNW